MEHKEWQGKAEKALTRLSHPGKKLSPEEVKEALQLLQDNGDYVVGKLYKRFINAENLKGKLDLYLSERTTEDADDVKIKKELSETIMRISNPDYFERNFNISIKGAMVEHYRAGTFYPYDMLSLMHLVVIDSVKNWYYENFNDNTQASLLDNISSIEKNIKLSGIDGKSSTALAFSIILLLTYQEDSYKDKMDMEIKSSKFIENPSEFINEPIGSVRIEVFEKDKKKMHALAEEMYKSMKKQGYFGELFPSYTEFLKRFQYFEDEFIGGIKDVYNYLPSIKFSTVMMLTYYADVIAYILAEAEKAKNPITQGELEDKAEKINSVIQKLVLKNSIESEEIEQANTLLIFVKGLEAAAPLNKNGEVQEGYG
ncbi:MAG: hypothetical protein ACP5RF_03125 [Candidatus Micrarchaeia archaeon]